MSGFENGVIASIFVIIAVFLVVLFTDISIRGGISRDCENFGAFTLGETKYSCKELSE